MNSTHATIELGIEPQIESDYLTEEDYAELKRLAEDEEPFKRLAKEL